MQITVAPILIAAAALAGIASAAPKGKAFDNFLQIWFENQVRTIVTPFIFSCCYEAYIRTFLRILILLLPPRVSLTFLAKVSS
jgi:hypothetical protein